ncbi:MAG TPA: hypothetical protein ENI23_17535 [bacterium]|nr:hypothetical protein [bacterium]
MARKKRQKKTSSLSSVTTFARRFSIGCVAIIVLVLVIQTIGRLGPNGDTPTSKESYPYLDATNGYGDLPVEELETLLLDPASNPAFALENRFGEFPLTANVYKVEQPRETFGAVEKAQTVAERLEFEGNFTKLSEQELEWKTPTRSLEFNKVLRKWDFSVDLINDEAALEEHVINPDLDIYITEATSLLSELGILRVTGSSSTTKAYFMRLNGGELEQVSSPTQAQFVQVHISLKKEIVSTKEFVIIGGERVENEKLPIDGIVNKYENPLVGSAVMLLSDRAAGLDDLYGFGFTEWRTESGSEVYDIVSVDTAWERIQDGQGILRSLQSENSGIYDEYVPLNVARFVTSQENVSLGFFEFNQYKEYQTPYFIFEGRAELVNGGDANFMFFVDALKR